MNENLPTNVQLVAGESGTVSFASDVVATIAGLATTEVEGVQSMAGGSTGLADILGLKQSARSLTKGVRVELSGSQVDVGLTIVVDYGFPIPEVAGKIQDNVKKAIETMTGLTAREINIYVQGVSFERENRAVAELQQQQQLLLKRQEEEPAAVLAPEPTPEPEIEPAVQPEPQVFEEDGEEARDLEADEEI